MVLDLMRLRVARSGTAQQPGWNNRRTAVAAALPDMPTSLPDDAAALHADRASSRGAPHLLVWVGNHPHAEALVRHAAALVASCAMPWTVISVETPVTGNRSSGREHALRALRLAEELGAATATPSADTVIAAVVQCARSAGASMVLIGGRAADGWLDGLQWPWLGSLADALSARLPGVTIDVVHFPDDTAAPPIAAHRPPGGEPARRGWWQAIGAVALCTLVSELLLSHIEPSSAAMIYFAGVVYVALRQGQSAALLAVVLSILVFDLLVVLPRWSFKPTDPQYYFTFLVMLVVGLLISRLAEQARRQTRVAEARARRAQALNQLASQLVSAQSEQDVGAGLAAAVRTTFGVSSALLLPDERGRLVDPSGFCRAGEAAAAGTDGLDELARAQQAFDTGRRTETAVGPSDAELLLCLPLPSANGALGVFVVRPAARQVGTPEDRHLLDAFINQAALALERSLLERRRAAAVLEAESERLRSTVLSGVSHDFRTPLTTIIGSATSLLEQNDALDESRRTRLQQSILTEARRIHAAMSDLLDLTRMEEGVMQLHCEWCPADDLIDEARQALGTRLQDREVTVQLPPDAVVWCDARLVEQVLVNLLDNTLRHTPAHCRIRIGVELGEGQCRLIVADDGPGLPAEHEREVFRKFFRGRGESAGAGTGLGLAICAAVARLHHGRIEASSEGGACFTMTWPQPVAPEPALEEEA